MRLAGWVLPAPSIVESGEVLVYFARQESYQPGSSAFAFGFYAFLSWRGMQGVLPRLHARGFIR
jgi:hypothetical protein